ncbi:DUF7288 family protein [Natronobeatus ordinarius]|uniref:DUF7288 family protein n=1 Tax=Natronobeatus ordinarius TaxID=2963433 RepID=UPI0020CC8229|nr:hypothetical protein [Natronobeatus ordinarius]
MRRRQSRSDRGQAYTLEGFIGSMAVLLAVLLAMQAVVITPTTGGTIDRSIQAQQQQELQDSLVVADAEGNLSAMVRHWEINESTAPSVTFENESLGLPQGTYEPSAFEERFLLGEILGERFAEGDGRNYNVELHHQNESDDEPVKLVYQGQPDTNAFTASKIVTLYDDQHLTGDESTSETLGEVYEGYPDESPIPNVDDDQTIYNVVEVRVVVW